VLYDFGLFEEGTQLFLAALEEVSLGVCLAKMGIRQK
jgi:hypothetical protein